MTSDYVIAAITLCTAVRNVEYIILYNFGGCRMSGFQVIDRGPPRAPGRRKQKRKKNPGLNGVKD